MLGYGIKSLVAQNCPGYESRYASSILSMGSMAESCDSCANFVRGKCKKDLYDSVKERITIN